ncbi:baseplate hub protein [Ewingella americana]
MYNKKELRYEFTLSKGNFDNSGNNKLSLGNVKSSFRVGAYGDYGGTQAEITIFGLSVERLASLSGQGVGVFTVNANDTTVDVYVENTKVYSGGIYASYANMNGQPETALVFNAIAGLKLKTEAASPFSHSGSVTAYEMLSAICRVYGFGINYPMVNSPVEQNPHYSGSPMDKIRSICEHHNLSYQIFDNVLTVWPKGKAVDDVVPIVSAEYGLIGYPVFSQYGITFQTQYSPLLAQGRDINLETSLPNASGRYSLSVVEHFLSSWTEGGSWHTVCQGYRKAGGDKNGK